MKMDTTTTTGTFSEKDGTLKVATVDGGTQYQLDDGTSLTIPDGNSYATLKNDAINYNLNNKNTFDDYINGQNADKANYALDFLLNKIPIVDDVRQFINAGFNDQLKFTNNSVEGRNFISGQVHFADYIYEYNPQSGIQIRKDGYKYNSVQKLLDY